MKKSRRGKLWFIAIGQSLHDRGRRLAACTMITQSCCNYDAAGWCLRGWITSVKVKAEVTK